VRQTSRNNFGANEMSATNPTSLLSGRAKDRLFQLQRLMSNEYRALSAQQSLLHGALQACDLNTQSAHLQEYLERVNTLLSVMVRLRLFASRHCDTALVTDADNALDSAD
jgi:hypothetical protein